MIYLFNKQINELLLFSDRLYWGFVRGLLLFESNWMCYTWETIFFTKKIYTDLRVTAILI